MSIMEDAVAQVREDGQTRSSYIISHHTNRPISSSGSITDSSPIPIDSSFSATSSTNSVQSNKTPIIIQDNGGEDLITATAINAGDLVHVLWRDDITGNFEIFYKRDGADFDPTTINLSNNAGNSLHPAMAVLGSTIHVVWTDTISGLSEILYKKSTDSGATFGPTINISNNAGFSENPEIAISGTNVYLVWLDSTSGNFDIFYKRSTNGGDSFSDPTKNLSANAGSSRAPSIAVSGNSIHVVWSDDTHGTFDIFYRRSQDGGTTFPNVIKNLSDNVAGASARPAIFVSDDNVHVVWDDSMPGTFDIFYRRSQDGGTTFPNVIKNLSDNAGTSTFPKITGSGANIYIVWEDTTPGISDILYRRSVNGGGTFDDMVKNLSGNAASSSTAPAIATSGSNVYSVWQDATDGTVEILYRTSTNNGATFPAVMTDISANAGSSTSPEIAVS